MVFLKDPFMQFLINIVIAFTSLVFSALSLLLSQQITLKESKSQQQKLPRTGPLARERNRKVWVINILAIIGSLLMILYCSLEAIDSAEHPDYLYAGPMIFLFIAAGIGCIIYIITRVTKIIRGEPKIPALTEEDKNVVNH